MFENYSMYLHFLRLEGSNDEFLRDKMWIDQCIVYGYTIFSPSGCVGLCLTGQSVISGSSNKLKSTSTVFDCSHPHNA